MAEGTEVGRIYVRVSPDTKDFREELRGKLAAIERELEGEIPFDGDVTEAEAKAEKAAKSAPKGTIEYNSKVEKLNQKQVDAAKKGVDTDFEFTANLDRFRKRELARFQKLMSEFETNIPLNFDGELLRQKYKDLEAGYFEKLKLLDPKKDKQTLTELRREIRKFYTDVHSYGSKDDLLGTKTTASEYAAFKGELSLIKAKVDLSEAEAQMAAWRAYEGSKALEVAMQPNISAFAAWRAKLLAGAPKLVVDVEVDRTRFQKSFNNAFTQLANTALVAGTVINKAAGAAASGFSAMADGASSTVKAIASLPQWVLLTAAVMAVLAPALALVSGLLVALPGVLASIAVPLGVVALGMDGIKKAAETAKPAFEELKKTISSTFEQGMLPGFEAIRDRLIPGLTLPLKGVAESLSGMFNGVVDTLTSPSGLNGLQKTIDNVAAAVKLATPGVQAFTDGLTKLVAKLSEGFPGFAAGFSKLGDEFSGWIDKITANGQLDSAMQSLKGVLGEIGGLIKDIAGWSFDQLADPEFGNTMKEFVADLRTIVNQLLPGMRNAFELVANTVKPIAASVEAIGKAMDWVSNLVKLPTLPGMDPNNMSAFDKVKFMWKAANGENPFEGLVKQGSEAGDKAGGEAGKKFQESLAAVASGDNGAGLTDAINSQLLSAVDVSKDLQKEAFKSAFTGEGITDAVGNQIGTQMGAVIARAQAAIRELGPTLQADIDAALVPMAQIPEKLTGSFTNLGAAIGGAWAAVKGIILQNVTEISNSVVLGFQNIPNQLMGSFAALGGAVGGAMGALRNVVAAGVSGIAETFTQAFSGIPGRVSAALSGVPSAILGVLSAAAGAAVSGAGLIVNGVLQGLQPVLGVVNQIFAAIPGVIQAQMGAAVGAVQAGCSQMVAAALSFAGGMEQAGVAIGASFARGIASTTGLVANSAAALMTAARAFFPNSPAEEGPFSGSGWVDKSGEAVGKSFSDGLSSSQQEVVSTARALMQSVKDIFGSAEGLTLNFNMGPVTQQAEQATASVKSFGDALTAVPAQQFDALAPSSGESQLSKDELDRQILALEMERKSLELQKGQANANQDAIKARLEEIKQQKLQLGLQRDQLNYATKYGDQVDQTGSKMDQFYKDIGKKVVNLPTDFAKATGQQFMTDLGIGGQGAIPQLLEQGSQYIFQVMDMDSALGAKQRLQNKQTLGTTRR